MSDLLVLHTAASTQQDDVSNFQGGAIDIAAKLLTTNLTRASKITLVSNSGLDQGQVYFVEGIAQSGAIVSENVAIAGIVSVETIHTYIKIFRVAKAGGSPLVGSVTVSGTEETLGILKPNTVIDPSSGTGTNVTASCDQEIMELRTLLPKATSNPFKEKVFYDKFFILNCSDNPITFVIEEFVDPLGCVNFALDPDFNNDSISANRLVRPATVPVGDFDSIPKTVTSLPSKNSIGVWLQVIVPQLATTATKKYVIKITIGSGDTAIVCYYTLLTEGAPTQHGISERRYNFPLGGGNPHQYMELLGGKIIQFSYYEPDPRTFRDKFYYNTRLNWLFKKILVDPGARPIWKRVR